jgi:hypothetical protein
MTLVLLWGTFAALVAFAVRYELGPFALPESPPSSQTQDISALGIAGSRLSLTQWSEAAPIGKIVDAFRQTLAEQQRTSGGRNEIDLSRLSMSLEFQLRDSTALWTARYDGGCDCPYEQASGNTHFTALIDPISAAVVGVSDTAHLIQSSTETR